MVSRILLLMVCTGLVFSCGKDNEKVMYVADTMANCTGVGTQKCLQIKTDENEDWSNFYGHIEGFEYEEGYTYKLKVAVSKLENPPADAASEIYTLIAVMEKTKTPVSLAKGSWLVTKIKERSDFTRNPTITLTLPQGQIVGSTGCNKYFGTIDLEGSNFKVQTIGSTKMACKNMDTEQLFLQTLNEVETFKIENDQLKLLAGNSVVMVCDYLVARE